MAIVAATARDQIAAALANNRQRLKFYRANLASQVAGGYTSTWKVGVQPAAGANPAAAALCTKATTGAGVPFADAGAGNALYVARTSFACNVAGQTLEIHDRIAHMGGLSGTVTTAQTVNLDPVALGAASDRTGAMAGTAAAHDLTWWLEWYTATGATAVTATVTYTNGAGVSGQTTTVAIPASTAASRAIPFYGANGEAIASVQSVQIATTGTAGNFGVTCTRKIADCCPRGANYSEPQNWADLGFPRVGNDACLSMFLLSTGTSSGTITGDILLIEV